MPRLTYSGVASTLALFAALGGGAVYAADKIGPKEIQRNAIRTHHIRANQVTGPKVKEATLSEVPRAALATSVGGVTVTPILQSKLDTDGHTQLANVGGSLFSWGCDDGGPGYRFQRSASGPPMVVEESRTPTSHEVYTVGPGFTYDASGIASWSHVVTIREGARAVEVEVSAFRQVNGFGTAYDCFLQGELKRYG